MDIPKYTPPDFFQSINISFLTGRMVFFIILLVYAIFYLMVSSVLIYHWFKYGMKSSGIIVAQTLYIFVSVFLFAFAILALSIY